MKDFVDGLKALIGDADGMRPFLCEGDPRKCSVALIGANPGTTTPFWTCWSETQGMNRAAWLEAYLALHGRYGRSRAAIERFIPLVHGPVVELNAHVKQSKRMSDLAKVDRTTDVLAYMLNAVKPSVIVCAGSDAANAVRAMNLAWSPAKVDVRHFIYWGRDSSFALAKQVNSLGQLHSV